MAGRSSRAAAGTPQLRYYALDALGSVRAVFDAAGQVVSRADYEPFGAAVPASTTGTLPRQQYTGHERDGEVGVDYFGARMYAPTLGRMPSVDPLYAGVVEEPQRWNRYAYALNNPITYIDPDGRMITCAEFAGVVRCNDSSAVSKAGGDSGNAGGSSWGGGGATTGGGGNRTASASDCQARTCSGGTGGGARALIAAHVALDVAGVVAPGVGDAADLVNAGIYLLEGDKTSAGLSAVSAVPFVGVAGTLSKWSRNASKAADAFRAVSPAEAADIAANGFRVNPATGAETGKWFAETSEGAERFREMFPGNSEIIRTTIPRSVYEDSFKSPNLDGLGPCIFVSCSNLRKLPRQK